MTFEFLLGFDMSCIKRLALTEPLIDNVGAQQVLEEKSCYLLLCFSPLE